MALRAVVIALLLAGCRHAASFATIGELRPGRTLNGSVGPGQEDRYRLEVADDSYAVVAVEGLRESLDLSIRGGQTSSVAQGRERVFFVPGGTGPRWLSIRAPTGASSACGYRIVTLGARALPSEQERRLAAERHATEGRFALARGTGDAARTAAAHHAAARETWRGLQDFPREAAALEELGLAWLRLDEKERARKNFDQAGRLWTATGDLRGKARNLQLKAMLEARVGELRKARELGLEAVASSRRLNDPLVEAQALDALAATRAELGETREALADYARALTRSREARDAAEEARALSGLGQLQSVVGEYDEAVDSLRRAVALLRPLGDKGGEAAALGHLGWLHLTLGRDQESESCFRESLERASAAEDRPLQAQALLSLGAVQEIRGELSSALASFGNALSLGHALDEPGLEASALHRIGRVHALEGRDDQAIDHYLRARTLSEKIGDRREAAALLADLGWAYSRVDPARAVPAFTEVVEMARAAADSVQESAGLVGLAAALRQRGDLAAAVRNAELALDRIEEQRSRTANLALRSSHLASRQDYYAFGIKVLLELEEAEPGAGHASRALELAERSRGRELLDSLGGIRERISLDLPSGLQERERRVREGLSRLTAWQLRGSSAIVSPEQTRQKAEEIRSLLREYEGIQEEVRALRPRSAAVAPPAPLHGAAIQAQVLDEDTALLSYALGREKSCLWLVTRASIQHFALPARDELEALAQQVYAALSTPRGRPAAAEASSPRDMAVSTRRLAESLLRPLGAPPPVKRLLVVADGALQYVPFAALPDPWQSGDSPLLERYEVVSAPSASVVALLRAEGGRRAPAPRSVAVLADPVFQADDPRVQALQETPPAVPGKTVPASDPLPRLARSRAEAEAALRWAAPGRSFAALDFAASRATALSPELADYRVVHFATHGILNSAHPELSGLVLSLVDETGRPQDGFLSLRDVLSLRLSADLVVLSGCRTAVGADRRGEGLLGLARGFMYAGATRVIASLWSVSDRAAAELMARLYERMLHEGLPPAAALREAQRSLRREPRYRDPYYWGGFVSLGEWR